MAKNKEPDKLAQDAAAALAAGMSYGRWKATQPIVHIHKDDVFSPEYKTCPQCGVQFIPHTGKMIFCSIHCQRKNQYAKDLDKIQERNREYQRKRREQRRNETESKT